MNNVLVPSSCVKRLFTISLLLSSCGGSAQPHSIRTLTSLKNIQGNGVLDYQIGPTWDKHLVTPDIHPSENSILQKTARATAKLNVMLSTATGFIIGEIDGGVLLATNHHVIENQTFCDQTMIAFEQLDIQGLRCEKVIATDTDLDLTLFTLQATDTATTSKLLAASLPTSRLEPRKGQDLLTIGYGFAGNNESKPMVDEGSDCKVYSEDGDIRFMADPDTVNPGPYKTWAFATGCDVSHGDSGSAMVDRKTGEVVGILSTGKIPKSDQIRSPDHLSAIFQSNNDEIWSELTYVVPFSKVYEKFTDILNSSEHSER